MVDISCHDQIKSRVIYYEIIDLTELSLEKLKSKVDQEVTTQTPFSAEFAVSAATSKNRT